MADSEKQPQKFLRSYDVQRFFEISPIHGCSYVGFRRSIYEGLFWTLVLITCAGFCINDVAIVVRKYTNQSTSISVILQRNQTLSFADAGVCFDVFREYLADSISAVLNQSDFNASLKVVEDRISASKNRFIDLSTLPLNDPDIDIVMKTAYLLIAAIIDYDLGTPGGGIGGFGYDDSTSRAVQLVEAFFLGRGYGYAQLYEQTARYMCYQMYDNTHSCPISLVGVNNSCVDICGVGRVNWVGNTMAFGSFDDICFALNTPGLQLFQSSADILVFEHIYVSRASRLIGDWRERTPKMFGYGAPHVLFDMRGWRALMDPRGMDSLAFVAAGTGFLIGAKIESYFIAYNHSWGTCGALQMADLALQSCLPAARIAADGCWPLAGYALTAAWKPPNVSVCNRQYTTAEIMQIPDSYVGNWQTCVFNNYTLPPCKAYTYDYSESLTSTAPSGVNATLYQGKLSYAVFEEYITMDFNAFLATLGGSLGMSLVYVQSISDTFSDFAYFYSGLYLGGSLISILHIPVYAMLSLVYSLVREAAANKVTEAKPQAMTVSKVSS